MISTRLSALKAFRTFKARHRPEVRRDCSDAVRKGVKRLVVTPKCVVLSRRADSSRVHVDLTADCRELKWLIKLYREECPKGMIIRFSLETQKPFKSVDETNGVNPPEHCLLAVDFMATAS